MIGMAHRVVTAELNWARPAVPRSDIDSSACLLVAKTRTELSSEGG